MIRKEAQLSYRTNSSVRIWWEFEEPKGPKGSGFRVGAGDLHLHPVEDSAVDCPLRAPPIWFRVEGYRGYSKDTAIGSYDRASPRSIGPP